MKLLLEGLFSLLMQVQEAITGVVLMLVIRWESNRKLMSLMFS